LGRFGGSLNDTKDRERAVAVLSDLISLKKHGLFVSVQALNALGELGPRAAPALPAIRAAEQGADTVNPRQRSYVPRLVEKLLADLKG
jgi:hypothetical protein